MTRRIGYSRPKAASQNYIGHDFRLRDSPTQLMLTYTIKLSSKATHIRKKVNQRFFQVAKRPETGSGVLHLIATFPLTALNLRMFIVTEQV